MKKLFLLISVFTAYHSFAQNISKRLQEAYQKFEKDTQLSNAISSLYVINANTGEVVFDRNSKIGMATASTLKIVTAATAYELLGRDFSYKTQLGYNGKIENGVVKGDLCLIGSGDPTFGSWRYAATTRDKIVNEFCSQLKNKNITAIEGGLYVDETGFSFQPTPGGWIWDDIGNYYGAGTWAVNWNENQFNLILRPGKKVGDTTEIVGTDPDDVFYSFYNQITTGNKGSGDNGYIYLPPYTVFGYSEGTIPLQEEAFTISGALPSPVVSFDKALRNGLQRCKIEISGKLKTSSDLKGDKKPLPPAPTLLFTHASPSLDSIIYWFLKKSINLYGEALTKTFACQKNGLGATSQGVEIMKNFWKEKGIAPTELNIVDGSGLSPLNRVTTHAQVAVLKYASSQAWFNGYYNAFPEYDGMKMKSGTISDVKGYCGYQKSKDGHDYIFSFLVNNYNGSSSSVVQKMYKVLDELK